MRHPVRGEYHDVRVARRRHDLPHSAIDGTIHEPQRISSNRGHGRIVCRMLGVVQMPTLMPHAVRLCEHLHEEIPRSTCEQLRAPFRLAPHALFERGDERAILVCTAPARVARRHRAMSPGPYFDLR